LALDVAQETVHNQLLDRGLGGGVQCARSTTKSLNQKPKNQRPKRTKNQRPKNLKKTLTHDSGARQISVPLSFEKIGL